MLKRYLYLPLAVAIGATKGKRPKKSTNPPSLLINDITPPQNHKPSKTKGKAQPTGR
jgi:hypothetical protein